MDKDKLKDILEKHEKWLRSTGGERAVLCMDDLSGADLRGVNLSGANLYASNLSGANLWGAILEGAEMFGANLSGANLYGVNLEEANLCESDLRWANLCYANLYRANLSGAKLSEKVIQVGPIGSRREYTIFWVDRNLVKCGCWNDYDGGSLDEFKQRVDKTYPAENKDTLQFRNEYLAAIAMFERLRDDARKSV